MVQKQLLCKLHHFHQRTTVHLQTEVSGVSRCVSVCAFVCTAAVKPAESLTAAWWSAAILGEEG